MTTARPSTEPTIWRVIPVEETPRDSYPWILLGVVGIAVTGFGSLMTLVTVSLGTIAADLDTSVLTATWLLTGLMLAMAVGTPLGGKVSDGFGHKRVFMIGLGAMTAFMFLSAIASNITLLILWRVLFGVSGALLMPSSMALIMHAFPVEERAKALGWFQAAMTGGPTIGVVIGGPLIDMIGWRGIFVVFGGLALLALALGAVVVRPVQGHGKVVIDWLGTVLLGGGTLLVLLAIIRAAGGSRFDDPLLVGELVAALASFVLFGLWEPRAKAPLLDVRLFLRARFTTPLVASACNQFAYMGAFVLVPQLLQGPYGYSTGVAALIMLPRPGVFAVASPLGGWLATRIGERIPMVIGTATMIASMFAFAVGSDATMVWVVVLGLALSGVSAGVGSPAYQTLVANSVEAKDIGIANGMNQTMLWIGIIMGIQSMSAVAGEDPTAGRYKITFLFGAVVALIGLIAPIFVGSTKSTAGDEAGSAAR